MMKVSSSPSWAASVTLMVLGLTLSGGVTSSVPSMTLGLSGGDSSASSSSCSQRGRCQG